MNTKILSIYVIPELLKVTEKAIKRWNKALAGRAQFIITRFVIMSDVTIGFGLTDRSIDPFRVAQCSIPHNGQYTILLDSRVKWSISGWQRFLGTGQEDALGAVMHELGHTLGIRHSDNWGDLMHRQIGTTVISSDEAFRIRTFLDERSKAGDF